MNKKNIIVCRCEDITLEEVEAAIDAGYTSLEELKRVLRVGMGPCQGRTCGPMLKAILARKLGVSQEELEHWTTRPPVVPLLIKSILGE